MMWLFFSLGLVCGSFLNVCLSYYCDDRTTLWGRSYCVHCHHTLAWYDLIPVVSFLMVKGRCRSCHHPISKHYPIVELATCAVWMSLYAVHRDLWTLIFLCLFASCLFLMALCDAYMMEVSDQLQLFAFIFVFLYDFIMRKEFLSFLPGLLSMGGILLAVYYMGKGCHIGGADIKMMISSSLLLSMHDIWLSLWTACIFAIFVEIVLLRSKRRRFPFLPYLSCAVFLLMLTI